MEFEHCFCCMAQTKEYPCPVCGFDPGTGERSENALKPGTILKGRYVAGMPLVQGGMSITYVGWDLAQDQKVSIQEYYPVGHANRQGGRECCFFWDSTDQADAAENGGKQVFLLETERQGKLSGIPQAAVGRDVFEENGTAYIVADFVEGKTIHDRLSQVDALSWAEVKQYCVPAIEAMEKIHESGIIHQQLCPEHLLLQPDGTLKILDFSAAVNPSERNMVNALASPYVAPESYVRERNLGPWTDVYSMAATMYCALTGKPPASAIDRLVQDTMDWVLLRRPDIPENVSAALQKAMILKESARTQSMPAFLADLQVGRHKAWLRFGRK